MIRGLLICPPQDSRPASELSAAALLESTRISCLFGVSSERRDEVESRGFASSCWKGFFSARAGVVCFGAPISPFKLIDHWQGKWADGGDIMVFMVSNLETGGACLPCGSIGLLPILSRRQLRAPGQSGQASKPSVFFQ